MFCKWCGLESKDDKRCEWCGRPLVTPAGADVTTASAPTKTTAMQPAPAAEKTTAMSPSTAVAPPPRMSDPRERAAERAKNDAVGKPFLLPFWWRMERYLGVMTLLIAAGMFTAHHFPNIWLVPFLVLLFPSGILMGAFRVVGYYDDNHTDVLILMIASGIIGPLYGTAIYLVAGLIKQELNYSMLGLMASYFVILIATAGSAGGIGGALNSVLALRLALDPFTWCVQIAPLTVLFGGWMCASFTRPLNE